ncbi:transporter substrate-binding domain-containing protein [Azospirillum sp. YIM B02556]|uniref:Transporter substrate-binding domain-containing protein n=1 Tax=Azospirillum endophyticum TaxID=2800326 RepID=A0ABS1FHA5_9PROT|nr:transporter substrate-binding domain-containing protein [Azospirillum endophyticum]MBK1842772.1 transporter substrate-binding domain-containing protein [Azospirillum endophyticum]
MAFGSRAVVAPSFAAFRLGIPAAAVLAVLLSAALLPAARPAAARPVTVLAPEVPPMMTAGGTGREASIIAETLAACGHEAQFKVVPFGRHWNEFRDGARGPAQLDAVATVPEGMEMPGSRSVPYILYQNGASVLKSSGLAVQSLADLAGKRVITFSGAPDVLPGLRAAIPSFGDFRERADQMVHSNLLFAGRVDAVLADGLIFAEYNRQLQEKAKTAGGLPFDPAQPVQFTAIFPPTLYSMVFRDESLRADFDRCFAELKAKGRIDAIDRETVARYAATVGDRYLPQK